MHYKKFVGDAGIAFVAEVIHPMSDFDDKKDGVVLRATKKAQMNAALKQQLWDSASSRYFDQSFTG